MNVCTFFINCPILFVSVETTHTHTLVGQKGEEWRSKEERDTVRMYIKVLTKCM